MTDKHLNSTTVTTSLHLVLIEDDSSLRMAIEIFLHRLGHKVIAFEGVSPALQYIKESEKTPVDLVLSDIMIPGRSGFELLDDLQQSHPKLPVILMTAYGTIDRAVMAMKKGAYDFIVKPFELSTLENVVNAVVADRASNSTVNTETRTDHELLTEDPVLLAILDNLKKVSHSRATVVLQGESGTGKEMLARYLHNVSPRASQPFIGINCAALPDNLLESELFGHEKGSFTGAIQQQIGKFEAANHGTILLDEITEMSLTMQTKLLRVLQESEIYRVGGVKPIPLNIRVVATTNRNLHEYMKQGHFREDLYYRINVIPVTVPPLRDRRADVLPLARYYLKYFADWHHKDPVKLGAEQEQLLTTYTWPGNVRELRNVMERVALMSDLAELPALLNQSRFIKEGNKLDVVTLSDVEKKHILDTLELMGGNRTKTAEKLGISIRTLRNKLNEYFPSDLPDEHHEEKA